MNASDEDFSNLAHQRSLNSPLKRSIGRKEVRINEEARICANDLNSLTSLFVGTAEKISFFSRRTASTLLGGALGGVVGILCVSSPSDMAIQKRYEDIFILFSAIGGAGIGCLCIKETMEERARRVENAAIKIAKTDRMEGFRDNLAIQHAALTGGDANHIIKRIDGKKDASSASPRNSGIG